MIRKLQRRWILVGLSLMCVFCLMNATVLTSEAAEDDKKAENAIRDWSGEEKLKGKATQIAVAHNANGSVVVLYAGKDKKIYYDRQTAPNSAEWVG